MAQAVGKSFKHYYMYGTLIGPVVLSTAVGKKGFTTETKETVRLREQRPTLKKRGLGPPSLRSCDVIWKVGYNVL